MRAMRGWLAVIGRLLLALGGWVAGRLRPGRRPALQGPRQTTLQGVGNGRRLIKRSSVPARVLVVPLEASREPFWARAQDLSSSGVFVPCSTLMPVGSLTLLKITADDAHPFWVHASVVHAVEGMGFGCRFTRVPVESRQRLGRLLSAVTPKPHADQPPPGRAARHRTIGLFED